MTLNKPKSMKSEKNGKESSNSSKKESFKIMKKLIQHMLNKFCMGI